MSNRKKVRIIVIVMAIVVFGGIAMLSLFSDVPGDDKTVTVREKIVSMALEDSKDVSVDIIGEDVYYRFFIKDDNGENQFIKIPVGMAEMYKINDDEASYCEKVTAFKTTKVKKWGKIVDEAVDDSPYSTVYRIYVSKDAISVSARMKKSDPAVFSGVDTELF